jgi:hypothetical protein
MSKHLKPYFAGHRDAGFDEQPTPRNKNQLRPLIARYHKYTSSFVTRK